MRSEKDYQTDQELLLALSYVQISLIDGQVYTRYQHPQHRPHDDDDDQVVLLQEIIQPTTTMTTTATLQGAAPPPPLPKNADWVLTNYNPETTKEQTVQDEFERLRVLQSYMILDVDSEEVFEGLTAMAAHDFIMYQLHWSPW